MIAEAGELHHVCVVVPSIAESLPFYREGLGMRAGDVLHVARPHAESFAVERERLRDRGHDDADVVQLAGLRDHPRSAGTCVPNDDRRSAQISPSVTSPSTADTMSGMRF